MSPSTVARVTSLFARRSAPASHSILAIDVDGTRAHAVKLTAGVVEGTWAPTAATAHEAIKHIVDQARADQVRVTTTSPTRRTAHLTPASTSRAALEEAAHTALGTHPEEAYVAFDFDCRDTPVTAPSLVIADAATHIAATYAAVDNHTATLTPPELVDTGADGLHIHLRTDHALMTLVEHGRVTRHHSLTCGGLAALQATLGTGSEAGVSQLDTALRTAPSALAQSNPDAHRQLTAYARLLASLAKDTTNQWRALGSHVPTTAHLQGRGSASPAIHAALNAVDLTPELVSGTRELATVDRAHRHSYLTAYHLAAATTPAPSRAFPNPAALATVTKAAARRHNRHTRGTFAILAVLIALAAGGPAAARAIGDQRTANTIDTLVADIATKHDVTHEAVRDLLAAQTATSAATNALNTLTSTLTKADATYQLNADTLTLSVPDKATTTALEAVEATGATIRNTTTTDGTTTITLELP